MTTPSQPPILLLPNEILKLIFDLLIDPTPDLEAYERALGWQTYTKGDPPEENTPGTLAAVANSCWRFHLLAAPLLYDTLLVYLPRQPKRVHRLYRTLSEHPELAERCNYTYVVRDMDESDDWVSLTAGFTDILETDPPPREVRDAREKLRELIGLLVSCGVEVRERHEQWEQPHPRRNSRFMPDFGVKSASSAEKATSGVDR
ncbi:hypothetical protein C8A00DRAFT_36203 [Chaetomidium leptoderma]|uniref:F-box domain-containing protein n=1 Tax=Chaetomidium leptoderma TaxID=669021 RepID=A0AAN6VGR2_9PEZI|nr:hypothetical protein C8A00DRAFT_36203 [Chaetomidium leptoderma]